MDTKYEQTSLLNEQNERVQRPVECLGLTFDSDEARRAHFLEILREKLRDPEFRKIEGFPRGDDEDILALSDPPYYTACPNPFIADFIKYYGSPYNLNIPYSREPFAADVSEGKNDPIYNAHSYHTKVPHKAIMRYILHYTEPGDIVFDGFCGSGMTGVAAQMCGNRKEVESLGYHVLDDGSIIDEHGKQISKLGLRHAILSDLSPAATLIAAGYNIRTDINGFVKVANEALRDFQPKFGWMYETRDSNADTKGKINYTVWSDIFTCPDCSNDIVFWDAAYDEDSGKVAGSFRCPFCNSELSKRTLKRKFESFLDPMLGKPRQRVTQQPIIINYSIDGKTKSKTPDENDLEVLRRIETTLSHAWYPTVPMMFHNEPDNWGDLYRGYHEGISYTHDFYLARPLLALSYLWQLGETFKDFTHRLLWKYVLQSVMVSFTRRNRFLKNAFSQVNRGLSGTLYVGSTISEPSPAYVLRGKLQRLHNALPSTRQLGALITTQSLSQIKVQSNSIDYIFLDPPFGDNIPYSELNFLWEAWFRVFTAVQQEAIVSNAQGKALGEYTKLMKDCLAEAYRVLKPGRWLTIEFHNSKNAVWNAIQDAIGSVGFVIADVRILDKGMLTKKQISGANAVNKDLVISAYKPNGGLEERFRLGAGTEAGAWDFVRTHLRQLPIFVSKEGQAEVITERMNYLLFDRMVAYHVQHGVAVPLSASEFYAGLVQRFPERDGMYFLPDQVAEYDKKRITVKDVLQLQLFVIDESSAIRWLRQLLTKKPQTFQDIHPQFMKELGGWQKHEKQLELSELLEQNFLRYDGRSEVPSQIHCYLSTNFKELRNLDKDNPVLRAKAKDRWYVPDPNKAIDLEKLREKSLLKEFDEYKNFKGRQIKIFRLEAIRAGFKKAWQERDYQTIIDVAHKIHENVLQEDTKLLMWYDQAKIRTGDES